MVRLPGISKWVIYLNFFEPGSSTWQAEVLARLDYSRTM